MATNAALGDVPAKDPHLPPMHRVRDLIAPTAPDDIAAAGLEEEVLSGLVMKLGYVADRLSTDWVSKRLHLSPALVNELLEKLSFDGLVEKLWQTSQAGSHYKITQRGREHAARLLE